MNFPCPVCSGGIAIELLELWTPYSTALSATCHRCKTQLHVPWFASFVADVVGMMLGVMLMFWLMEVIGPLPSFVGALLFAVPFAVSFVFSVCSKSVLFYLNLVAR